MNAAAPAATAGRARLPLWPPPTLPPPEPLLVLPATDAAAEACPRLTAPELGAGLLLPRRPGASARLLGRRLPGGSVSRRRALAPGRGAPTSTGRGERHASARSGSTETDHGEVSAASSIPTTPAGTPISSAVAGVATAPGLQPTTPLPVALPAGGERALGLSCNGDARTRSALSLRGAAKALPAELAARRRQQHHSAMATRSAAPTTERVTESAITAPELSPPPRAMGDAETLGVEDAVPELDGVPLAGAPKTATGTDGSWAELMVPRFTPG